MTRYRKNIGDYGEELASQFLTKRGYTIVARKFASLYGELDIVALHPEHTDTLCCIEVKTRLTDAFGSPEEAITREKIKRLHDTACSYFFQHNVEDKIFRLDAISILINSVTKKAIIKHIKGIGYEDL